MALFHLYAELVLVPSSIRVGFGPTGALAVGFDRFPPQLQEALGQCTAIVRLIYEAESAPKEA